ncbi:MAG: PEP-CTERM sorting domain-containing protein [Planctomycetota bacterium]
MKAFLCAATITMLFWGGALAEAGVTTTYGSWVNQLQGDTVGHLYFEYVNGSEVGSGAGQLAASTPLLIGATGAITSQPTITSTTLQIGSGMVASSADDRGLIFLVSVDGSSPGAENFLISGFQANFNSAVNTTITSTIQAYADFDGENLIGFLGTTNNGTPFSFSAGVASFYALLMWNQSIGTNSLQNISFQVFDYGQSPPPPPPASVPEPSTLLVFGAVVSFALFTRRRSRS